MLSDKLREWQETSNNFTENDKEKIQFVKKVPNWKKIVYTFSWNNMNSKYAHNFYIFFCGLADELAQYLGCPENFWSGMQ